MKTKVFCFIFVGLFGTYETCKCIPPTIRSSFCAADVVAHVKVTNATPITTGHGGTKYTIEYVNIFKRTAAYDAVENKNIVLTPPTGGACGVFMDVTPGENDWLIFGRVHDGSINIHSCDANRKWNFEDQKKVESFARRMPRICEDAN